MATAGDTSEEAARVQLEVYRRMTPLDRLRVGPGSAAMSRALVVQGIRSRHPEYSDEELRCAFIRAWIGRELFERAYPHCPRLDP
jgi:hypothetical protein